MKNYNIVHKNRIIAIIAFLIPLIGIFAEFSIGSSPWVRLFSSAHLSFLDIERSGILNVIFYGLMLLGALFYVFNKFKKTGLIRLCFSVIILNRILYFIAIIIIMQVKPLLFQSRLGGKSLLFFLCCFISLLVYGGLSLICLKWLNAAKKTEKNNESVTDKLIYEEAPLSVRFFHHIIDLFLCVSLFYPLFSIHGSTFYYITQKFPFLASEKGFESLYLLYALFFSRFLYYIFFEGTYNATPAKFLTETVVIKKEGPVTIKTIILRTMIRFVPFEPFSFLGHGRWHEHWSSTLVVREQENEEVMFQT